MFEFYQELGSVTPLAFMLDENRLEYIEDMPLLTFNPDSLEIAIPKEE